MKANKTCCGQKLFSIVTCRSLKPHQGDLVLHACLWHHLFSKTHPICHSGPTAAGTELRYTNLCCFMWDVCGVIGLRHLQACRGLWLVSIQSQWTDTRNLSCSLLRLPDRNLRVEYPNNLALWIEAYVREQRSNNLHCNWGWGKNTCYQGYVAYKANTPTQMLLSRIFV